MTHALTNKAHQDMCITATCCIERLQGTWLAAGHATYWSGSAPSPHRQPAWSSKWWGQQGGGRQTARSTRSEHHWWCSRPAMSGHRGWMWPHSPGTHSRGSPHGSAAAATCITPHTTHEIHDQWDTECHAQVAMMAAEQLLAQDTCPCMSHG